MRIMCIIIPGRTKKMDTKYNLEIVLQEDSFDCNPRDNDNLGSMVLFHNRYNLANECTKFTQGNHYLPTVESAVEFVNGNPDIFFLPVYMYDHSGVALQTSAFYDPSDSGQVGFIFVDKSKVRKEWNVKRISKRIRDIVFRNLESEVKVYSQYLNGEVYGYVISDENGETVDSCWGFIGYDFVKQCAQESLEYLQSSENN